MKKILISLIIITMLCFSITGAGLSTNNLKKSSIDNTNYYDLNSVELDTFNSVKKTVQDYRVFSSNDFTPYNELNEKEISIPWVKTGIGDLLEWYVRIVYNGQEYMQEIDISILDFQEQFLKHPEYAKILKFNIDNDMHDDIEVRIGFYWSQIAKPNGAIEKSLETRFRVNQLYASDQSSYGLDDPDGEFEVWSEIHVNWGLLKDISKDKQVKTLNNKFTALFNNIFEKIKSRNTILSNLIYRIFNRFKYINEEPELTPEYSDYFSIGTGYRSLDGEEIPRYSEKRFAFAKDSLFSPSIFQKIMDPGTATGQDPVELLFGFQSYQSATETKKYDIEFSVEFEPAVYLKSKFVPIDGLVYYFFDSDSRKNSQTKITFGTNILKGSGEDTTVSILLDKIDNTLGSSGSYMMFDVDLIDFEPLGGAFRYEASDKFDVSMIVNAPGFSEKVKVNKVPTTADLSWDLDFSIIGASFIQTQASGFVDLSMSSNLGGIEVFYPKETENDPDEIFLEVVDIPSSRASAFAKLDLDINNFKNQNNYIAGSLDHSASSRLDKIAVYLKNLEDPILDINSVPSKADGRIGLYWNRPQGYAYGASNGGATMNIDITYADFQISNNLQLRSGYLDTKFKIANDGYFGLDSSNKMISNTLTVNKGSTDSFSLSIGNVDADDFYAHWDFSGGKINDIGFEGMVDTLEDVVLSVDYQGKVADMELSWVLGQSGYFDIGFDQNSEVSIDFSDFAPQSDVFYIDGGLTISNDINYDMSWDFKQGSGSGSGSVDPGYFVVNQYVESSNIKNFDFEFTYQNKYGVRIDLDNLQFYLNFQWWKGDKLLPYIWLDYEVSYSLFELDLLWTNRDGVTQWYTDVDEWIL